MRSHRSDAGAFYATRRGTRLDDTAVDAGLRQTVAADDVTALLSLLEVQARMGVRA